MIGEITKNTKDHKGTQSTTQGAGRACAQGARPARGPVGRGGLRTPRFGERAAFQEIQEVLEIQERPCGATDEALCKMASAAKPSLQASKLPHNY